MNSNQKKQSNISKQTMNHMVRSLNSPIHRLINSYRHSQCHGFQGFGFYKGIYSGVSINASSCKMWNMEKCCKGIVQTCSQHSDVHLTSCLQSDWFYTGCVGDCG